MKSSKTNHKLSVRSVPDLYFKKSLTILGNISYTEAKSRTDCDMCFDTAH